MYHLKPPEGDITRHDRHFKLFLAGTIDMGNSVDWQDEVASRYTDIEDVAIFNPRRDNWSDGPEWVQDISNPIFCGQVEWELAALRESDCILMNLLPDSKSVVSMLELGLFAASNKMIVVCPEGFWRRGNVQIVCDQYDIGLYNTLEEALARVDKRIASFLRMNRL